MIVIILWSFCVTIHKIDMNKNKENVHTMYTTHTMSAIQHNDTTVSGGVNNLSPNKNAKKELEKMIELYLAGNPVYRTDGKINEIEIRFGSNNRVSKPFSRIDYENVVKQLHSHGFTTTNPNGVHMLRIQNEYLDEKTGFSNISKIRAEISGLDLIREYCKTNSIQHILDLPSTVNSSTEKVKFTVKSLPVDKDNHNVKPVDFPDFNFRVSHQLEQDLTPKSNIATNIMKHWNSSKKMFRYINRVRFEHPVLPIFADISIVKMNKTVKNKHGKKITIPEVTVEDAGVFQSNEIIEIEMELDNSRVGLGTSYSTVDKIIKLIHKTVRMVLGGVQGTKFPVSYIEINDVLQSYMKLLHGEHNWNKNQRRITSRDFIGPSTMTLQLENIVDDKNGDLTVPNIRNNYTVTDKSDGERELLFINEHGRIYMINTNMSVIFTGLITEEKTVFNTVMDGEYMTHDKHGNVLNLYNAFDIYFVNGVSKRELAFSPPVVAVGVVSGDAEKEPKKPQEYRLNALNSCIAKLKPRLVTSIATKNNVNSPSSCNFVIKCKEFYSSANIFDSCRTIMSNMQDGIYEYNTDGLIFTPSNTGVGSDRVGIAGPLHKKEWELSFKWKPPKFNTIDFLVSVKKDKKGVDEIHNIYKDGVQTAKTQELMQHKTLVLRCGFNDRIHGFLNPFQSIVDDEIPVFNTGEDDTVTYRPVPFQPTNPYEPTACFANILLTNGQMKTEENEVFEENMIVEFAYDMTLDAQWRWVPLRVRYDKTAQLRSGELNYGNAYHVANNNWYSIHNPITEEMITTGNDIPESVNNDEIYYNVKQSATTTTANIAKSKSQTNAMRNFHNLFVKRKLILSVSNRNDTLIDYAVGKAGDLSKWTDAKLKFVFGIDVSKDNIHNNMDGACARYLKNHKKYKHTPSALFVHGNSSNNIRNGNAFSTDKEKMISNSVFGIGPKDRNKLGKGVYKNYGIAQDGFNVSSCQFALHYFFENLPTLTAFIRNVAECTAINGYFVGTCFDGETVFQLLKNKSNSDGFTIVKNDTIICNITKLYDQTGFSNDENSLGMAINVYQETINKTFREYLVNFKYFTQLMENFGFVLLTDEESVAKGLPKSTGLFDTLFQSMKTEIEKNRRKINDYGDAIHMTPEERQISFMNRYFMFKKVRNVDATKEELLLNKLTEQLELLNVAKDIGIVLNVDNDNTTNDFVVLKPRAKYVRKLKHKLVIKK